MIWVKICGIMRKYDAQVAVEAGVDALGFNFYSKSPRAVEPRLAREIIEGLPNTVTPVGLFVDAPLEQIRKTAELCGFQTVQLHGNESPGYCNKIGLQIIKAVRVKDAKSLASLKDYDVKAFLLDTYSPGLAGGTGRPFDHQLVELAKTVGRAIIVAGGLTPDTVTSVIRVTRPYGVDVASGVESSPGVKDPVKVRAFVERAKATDVEMIHET
jgi:phosphoribosylanthranilate isomerase